MPYLFQISMKPMNKVIYVTGGARSGKSSHALALAGTYRRRVFLATAEAFDDEMRERIARHRDEREEAFTTIEEPLMIDRALRNLPEGTEVVLLDCLTVWLGNLMHHLAAPAAIEERIEALLDLLKEPPCDIILVSNEVGMGIVPENGLARSFRDLAGTLNRRVAAAATHAWLLCSGLPIVLKQP
jgi:adenosylcobinamide kinase / adenosylcobinamide-phosphate guanylyltransferase